MPKKTIFTKRTLTSANKFKIKEDILNSIEGDKGLRKEIARIFQVVNRRIENIENTGLKSPAVVSLGELSPGFTKFSVKGKTWDELKIEYGRAVTFLQKPTSTASGTRELYRDIAKSVNLPQKTFEQIIQQHGDDIFEGVDFKYTSLVSELRQTAKNLKNSIEQGAAEEAQKLQEKVDTIVNRAGDALYDIIKQFEKFK